MFNVGGMSAGICDMYTYISHTDAECSHTDAEVQQPFSRLVYNYEVSYTCKERKREREGEEGIETDTTQERVFSKREETKACKDKATG